MAQAVAGEAQVDCFWACNASDFVELYVGRGAARIRSLFQQVRNQARARYRKGWKDRLFGWATNHNNERSSQKPCCCAILFIDELDALAKTRSTMGSNDEREQTLNQLLTEMDGFATHGASDVTVIVMAATNRADVLDPAILRRFDRHIHVGYPDREGRAAILAVHGKRVPLGTAVDWQSLAIRTIGFSGADLRNVVNEAALLAVRDATPVVSQQQLERGVEKIKAMKASLVQGS